MDVHSTVAKTATLMRELGSVKDNNNVMKCCRKTNITIIVWWR